MGLIFRFIPFLVGFSLSTVAAPALKIGFVGALSGPDSEVSKKSLKALEMLVWQTNRDGGLGGRRLEVRAYDNQESPVQNFQVFKQIQKDGVVALIGGRLNNDAVVLSKLSDQAKIPLLITAASQSEITRGKKYVVRICPNSEQQASALSRFARGQLQVRTAVVVVDVSDSGSLKLSELFKNQFERSGGVVLQTYSLRAGEKEIEKFFSELSGLQVKPDLVFSAASALESGYLLSTLSNYKYIVPVLGNDRWQGADLKGLLNRLGKSPLSAYFPSQWARTFGSKKSKEFLSLYSKNFGQRLSETDVEVALAYDAGLYLLEALKSAGSVDPNLVMRALKNGNVEGVTGLVKLKGSNDPEKPIHILSMKGGELQSGVSE